MRKLKFCANLSTMFPEYGSILDRYDAAKAAGFRGVEIISPYTVPLDNLAIKLKDISIEQILINTHPGNMDGDFGLAAVPGRQADFLASFEKSLEYAIGLNCKRIHIMSGVLHGQENSPTCMDQLERNLRAVIPQLKANYITGLIEPICNFVKPGYVLSDFNCAMNVLQRIDDNCIQLQLDFFHLQQIHGNITRNVKELLPLTGHIQVSQIPLRNEPHKQGELDYGYVFDLLEQEEYTGWVGLEYVPSDPTDTMTGLNSFIEKYSIIL